MFLSIVTPAYNRIDKLPRLIESLTSQTCFHFEWVVIDDGSVDDTFSYIKNVSSGITKFTIKVQKQENQGKHVAINNALKIVQGDLFFIVDSDDYLPDNAVETIYKIAKTITEREDLVGVSGLKAYHANAIVGATYEGDSFLDITNLQRKSHGMDGDRAEIYYTKVLKTHPFPVFSGEKFLSEAVVWNKLAYEGKRLRFFNEKIYYCEYQADGLSNNIQTLFLNNWNGYTLYVNQELLYRKKQLRRINILLYYCQLAKMKNYKIKDICKMIKNVSKASIFLAYMLSTPYKYIVAKI